MSRSAPLRTLLIAGCLALAGAGCRRSGVEEAAAPGGSGTRVAQGATAAPVQGGSVKQGTVPEVPGVKVPGSPEGVTVGLACEGNTVFAAGFARGSKVPVVWTGTLDARAGTIAWGGKAAELTGREADYLDLAVDPESGGARFAVSGHDQFSICTGAFVFERQGSRWVETGHLSQPEGESDILFGRPLVLRGGELFTLELPGGHARTAAIHRFRRQGTSWSRSVVPFAPDAKELEWQLAVSKGQGALAVTTQHGDDRHFVDLHGGGGAPELRYVASVVLPGAAGSMAWIGDRVAVGLESAAGGDPLLFLEKGSPGWQIGARLSLPDGRAPAVVAAPSAKGSSLLVSTGEGLWLVDTTKPAVTHRLVAPSAGPPPAPWGAIASCGEVALGIAGEGLFLFRLPAER